MLEQLSRAVASRRDEMAQLTCDLIAVDTENPPGNHYRACAERLAEALAALGFESAIRSVPGGDEDPDHPRYWLHAKMGDGPRRVYFHGHYDVVPAQSASQFTPRMTDDTIFGRGSTDMKSGLVSMMYAMWALKEIGAPLDGAIELQMVPDEETGGALGSHALDANDQLVSDGALAMFTAEPTGGVVWHACRGAITARVSVTGRSAHVGLAHRGINAFEGAVAVAEALRRLKDDVSSRKTSYPIEPDDARRSILMMGGECDGGSNFNVVPDAFTFSVDRRINPEEDFETEKTRLLEAIDSTEHDVEVDVFQEARPAGVSNEHQTARALADAIETVRGKPAGFELCPGILEIRYYAARGVPAFAYGPGLLSVAHGPNEFVKRRDVEDVAVVYALAAARLLAPPE